jgi:pseudouridine-5'-phosphate glycosidase
VRDHFALPPIGLQVESNKPGTTASGFVGFFAADRNLRVPDAGIRVSEPVAEALAHGRPVVALESTIISHGLPRPENLAAAREFEAILGSAGVTPATIAVLDGVPRVGLEDDEIRRVAEEPMAKASVRDLPILAAKRVSAATTVASTSYLANLVGIRVFATGGLGGVHRGASESFDESADIGTLATTPITVVSAGVKSVLDIPATLERMETLSIPVLGYRTDVFPSFWLRESDAKLDWTVDSAAEVAEIMKARDVLSLRQGILVANPIPSNRAWTRDEHDRILAEALRRAEREGVKGKAVTPYLLLEIVKLSGGRSLEVNLDLARNNVRVAGEIAKSWAALV